MVSEGVSKKFFIILPKVSCFEFLTPKVFIYFSNIVWNIVTLFKLVIAFHGFLWSKKLRTGFSIHFVQYNLFKVFGLHLATTR